MTDLTPVASLDPVPQLETTDRALAGTGNPMNRQAQALLNRDAFRAQEIAARLVSADLVDDTDSAKGVSLVGRSFGVVESVTDLQTAPQVEASRTFVRGYSAGSNAGGGQFYWDAASTATDNGVTVIQVAGVPTGRWLREYSGVLTPAMAGADYTGVADSSAAFTALITAANAGDTINGDGGIYLLSTPVTVNKNGIKLTGEATVNFTTLSTTGGAFFFNTVSDAGIDGKWLFSGPETQASWEASVRTTLYAAIYFASCPRSRVVGVTGNGIRIVVSANASHDAYVEDFEVNGFLPNVAAPSTGGGTIVPPYTTDVNWVEALRYIDCDDAQFHNLRGDHTGDILVMGGTSLRPRITKVNGSHMHDNCVYISSADYTFAEQLYCDDCRGSVIKVRGSHTRIYDVGGERNSIGVTVSPLDTGEAIPPNFQMGGDVLVEGVWSKDGIFIALADLLEIGADNVALADVTFRKLNGKTMRGLTTAVPIRMTVAGGKALIEDFYVDGVSANYVAQIGGLLTSEAVIFKGATIRNGVCNDTGALTNIFNVKGWEIEDIKFAANKLAAASVLMFASNNWDGSTTNCSGDDNSYRIDYRTTSNRVTVKDCEMFVYDATNLEVYGNASNGLKNITTTAPYKAGQICLTSSGGVAISKGKTATTDWVAV